MVGHDRSEQPMRGLMLQYGFKRVILLCAILVSGCDLPPEELEHIRELMQVQSSKGQVYVIHSPEELSYMIENSDFNSRPEVEKEKLVSSVD